MRNLSRHLVPCAHCGKDVLDHMGECPFCHQKLNPAYSQGFPKETIRRIRLILNIIGFAVAAAFIIWRLVR